MKNSYLSFVRGYNDWDYCCSWVLSLYGFLDMQFNWFFITIRAPVMSLSLPPPFLSVYVMKEPICLILVGIIMFWCKYQNWSESRIPIQSSHTFKYIMEIYIICFPSNNNFMMMEVWVWWLPFINNFVELLCCSIREHKPLMDLLKPYISFQSQN